MKRIFVLLLGILFILSGCSGGNGDNTDITYNPEEDDIMLEYFDSSMPNGSIEFTHLIMDQEYFDRIIPLGQINPPGHTFPTDHIYFVLNGFEKPVYSPTQGKILKIEETGMYGDGAIRIAVTKTMTFYLGHIHVDADLEEGDMVSAGEQIGVGGNTSCVDFGLLNKNINNGFINPKMPITTTYGDKPLAYYTQPLRSQLYALVKPPLSADDNDYIYDGGVTDGEFALDVLGTLLGNWLKEGYANNYAWSDELAFGYDVYYPNQIRIGIGTLYNSFAISNEDNPVKPENVNMSSGVVTYFLYNGNNTSKGLPISDRMGIMIVQMLSNSRIRMEIFDDTTSQTRQFTSQSLYYVR